MSYQHLQVPADGEKITIDGGKLHVPNCPVLPFIEGDGTGPDIWRASARVFDAARALGLPIKLSATPGGITRPAPTFGQHTREVLGEFGFSAAEIDALYAANAVA